jgi:hypothetical protein
MKLLSAGHTNTKTSKNSQFTDYLSAILHLAPFTLSGKNVCPAASNGCAMACLNTAGRGRFNNVQQARIRKTKYLFSQRNDFMRDLFKDIHSLQTKANRLNQRAVVRLNGTSDIDWENIIIPEFNKNIFECFTDVQFYDYSKRIERFKKDKLPTNYHLTFSASESNEVACKRLLKLGFNVAVVFDREVSVKRFWGAKVVDGDGHDFRWMEGYQGAVIALKAKGKAKQDKTGFVRKIA